jgi:uracil-DNA glycosylase family 4
MSARGQLDEIEDRVVRCRACPRLVRHREEVARVKRRAYREETYWGRPVPAFGDPRAHLFILGLAPGAHGANRTGRMFTGDRSGQWLYRALHKAGVASQPISIGPGDGLLLRDAFLTATIRCAPPQNRPLPVEIDRCRPFLLAEWDALTRVRAILALGAVAFASAQGLLAAHGAELPRPRPRFAHGALLSIEGHPAVVASYHPSQQNTQTGRLTEAMLDAAVGLAVHLAKGPGRG